MLHQKHIDALNEFAELCHKNSTEKGFWEGDPPTSEKLCLIHEEISEALGADRENPPKFDKHCPDYLNFDIELADAMIRIGDLAAARGAAPLGNAIAAKMAANAKRAYKHGRNY